LAVVISDARREANRRNARKSTGPKTVEGKATACRNSWKHGFAAVQGGAVGADEARRIEERAAAWREEFGPRGDWQGWLVAELAGASVRLERIAASEVQARAVAARRASTLWDEDRRLEVEQLGRRLPTDPARVVATLRQSPHGCDWLIERWAALARLADSAGPRGWTEDESRLARDLMATPAESRVEPIGVVIDESGRISGPALHPAALARRQIAELQDHRDRVGEADEVARTLVEAGLTDLPSREVAHLRRYERATLRRLFWLSAQMKEAGLQPQAHATTTHPTAPVSPAERHDVAVPTSAITQPPTEVERQATSCPPEATSGRSEPNEPTLPVQLDRTKPFWIKSEIPPAPFFVPPLDRQRPDLVKLARREQKKRRERRSA